MLNQNGKILLKFVLFFKWWEPAICSNKMKLTLLTLDLLFLFQVKCYGTSDGRNENFEIFYKLGQDAYLENNFQLCVKKMEAALVDYKYYWKVISACKLKCQKKVQSQQHVVEHILGRVQ